VIPTKGQLVLQILNAHLRDSLNVLPQTSHISCHIGYALQHGILDKYKLSPQTCCFRTKQADGRHLPNHLRHRLQHAVTLRSNIIKPPQEQYPCLYWHSVDCTQSYKSLLSLHRSIPKYKVSTGAPTVFLKPQYKQRPVVRARGISQQLVSCQQDQQPSSALLPFFGNYTI
jgi:hypothetical protein